jgi:hypothetical protein
LLVDRVAQQVPFGTEGKALHVRARLTDEGRQWLDAAPSKAIEAFTPLGQIDVAPSFTPADPLGVAKLFVLRGRPVEQITFAGASALPALLAAIGIAAPGSVDGKIDDFSVELPSGPLPGSFATRPGLEQLRERLSITPHGLEVERIDGGRVLELELAPR